VGIASLGALRGEKIVHYVGIAALGALPEENMNPIAAGGHEPRQLGCK